MKNEPETITDLKESDEHRFADNQRSISESETRVGFRRPPVQFRWKPGQSGNSAGRPKSITLSEAYRKQLALPFPGDAEGRTYGEVIAERIATRAAEGDYQAAKEIADRIEGRARQPLNLAIDTDLQHRCRQAYEAVLQFAASNGLQMSPAEAILWVSSREPRAAQLLSDLIDQPEEIS